MSLHLHTGRPPAVVATDVCAALALGLPQARAFFEAPPVELRLATATYLELLGAARSPEEVRRVKRFVQAYPVLSLGPMASSLAVELLLHHGQSSGLSPLAALTAATALAHEIPLVTADPDRYRNIAELHLLSPY
jgi:predicted nucleic acid-binding protein